MSNLKEELYELIKSDIAIFDFIQEFALDGFWYLNIESPSNGWINTKFWATLGYKATDIPLDLATWETIIFPDDLKELTENFLQLQHHQTHNQPYDQVIRFKHKNDSTVWLHCRAIAIENDKTKDIKILCTYIDITEQKRKEEFLERCNTAAMIGYWELDLQTQKLYWSKTTKSIHEVDDDCEPDLTTAIDYYKDGESREKIIEAIDNAIKNGENYDLTLQIITANNNLKWVRSIGKVEFLDGKCVRLFGTFQDINTETLAKEEIIKEKQKLQSVIEGTNVGTWEWNVQTGETVYNERWAEIIGYTLEELAPISHETWENLVHPEDLKISNQKILDCFEKKIEFFRCECRMKHKDGHWVWIHDKGKVVTWTSDGQPLMMYGTHSDISEQKQIVERNKVFIEHTPTAIAMFDNNLKYLAVSEKWRADYRLEGINLIGKTHYEIFPEIGDDWKNIHQECLHGKSIKRNEDKFVRIDGTVQWLKWEIKPWYNDNNTIGGLLMYTDDITEQKKIEQSLLEKHTLLETILESIDVGIVACDQNGALTLFNSTTKRWHGLPLDDVHPSEFSKYYGLYDLDGNPLLTEDIPLIRTLRGHKVENQEILISSTNGTSHIVSTFGAQLRGPNNELFGAVVAMHDVTERKKALEKLLISEESFRGNFENAAIGMALLEPDGRWMKVNQTLCNIVGYTEEELFSLTFQDITHPEDLEADLHLLNELVNGERQYYHMQKRYFHKKGNVVHAILAASLARDQVGKPLYFISQIIDITQQKKAEAEIQALLDVTKDQNERLKNFAHIVSHNLRSHSGNISMMMDILLEEYPALLDNEYITLLKAASTNLKETIVHLNEVVLMNTTIIDNLKSVNLYNAIENAIQNVSAFAKDSNVNIKNTIGKDERVLAVPAYLDSIILNFLTNSIKYSTEERDSYVKLSTFIDKGHVVLTIEDNGLGIDLKRHGAKLFGMYKTFHAHKDARGIGLFITKNQIEAMGGKIDVISEVNKGTTFSIYFKHEKI